VLKSYYLLTKPGIIYGNAINTIGGFLFAAQGNINPFVFLGTIAGTSLIIASACVFNNYIDRGIDEQMARTRTRALVQGVISTRNALMYAGILGIVGFGVLSFYTNLLTVFVGLTGYVFYIIIYGVAKRRTVHGTLIGSISGAIPPVAGYTAVTNTLDSAALLLFLILVFWQMPHFYAIAIYRLEDYRKAGLPVLSVVKGIPAAKREMLFYALVLVCAVVFLTLFRYAGYTYLLVMGSLTLWWVKMMFDGFKAENDIQWARKVFKFSLVIILAFSLLISLDVVLP
jgi:protoheme IX farnesyltransferase